jgi:hypothetical protein
VKRRFLDEPHDSFELHVTPGADATHGRTLSHGAARDRPENSPRRKTIKATEAT